MMRTGIESPAGRVLAIELLGSPVLRQVAVPIGVITPEIRALSVRMLATMYGAWGQGLAAPQVSRSIRLAVVDVPPGGPVYVLVNPAVVWTSSGRVKGMEGCLSIPGVSALVERAAQVVVQASDLEGAEQLIEAEGELARCLQHEIDHLDGVLYTDRLSPLSRRMTLSRYHKLQAAGRRGEGRLHDGVRPS